VGGGGAWGGARGGGVKRTLRILELARAFALECVRLEARLLPTLSRTNNNVVVNR